MGSRYLFICLYIWLEKYFSRGDYRRTPAPAVSGFEFGRNDMSRQALPSQTADESNTMGD
jgi:hypothetical protein